jgi:pyroglutamyl-peptidase
VLREDGIRSLWFKSLGELGYRRLLLYELPLNTRIATRPATVELSVTPMSPSDVDEYTQFRPRTDAARLRARLSGGQSGLVARSGERIVHVTWVARGHVRMGYLDTPLALRSDEAMLEIYTDRDHRSLGIATAVCSQMLRELQSQGIRRALVLISPENAPSKRVFAKLGYRKLGTVRRFSFGDHRRTRLPSGCALEVSRHAATVLVTGFDAFGELEENPSAQLVDLLAGSRSAAVRTAILPTSYSRGPGVLASLVEKHRPACILMFGYRDVDCLRLEKWAQNRDSVGSIDNDGVAGAETVVAGGRRRLAAHAGLRRLRARLRNENVPVEISKNAGGYVCNHVYYHALSAARRSSTTRLCLFAHVGDWQRSPRREEIVKGAKILVDHCIRAAEGR